MEFYVLFLSFLFKKKICRRILLAQSILLSFSLYMRASQFDFAGESLLDGVSPLDVLIALFVHVTFEMFKLLERE